MSYKSNSVEERFNMSYESKSVEGRVPAVVGAEYVVQNPFALNIVRKKSFFSRPSNFSVEDENKNCVFRGHRSSGFSTTIRLRDTNDVPVLCLHQKAVFSSGNWKIYSGSEPRNDALLFKWKAHWWKDKIDLYLSANILQEYSDFTIKLRRYGNFKVLYQNKVIAEAKEQRSKIFVSAVPHVDQAFIAAILVLMEEDYEERSHTRRGSRGRFGGGFGGGGGGGGG